MAADIKKEMQEMNRLRWILVAAGAAGAVAAAGAAAVTVYALTLAPEASLLGRSLNPAVQVQTLAASASPNPTTPKSNENASHEAQESAAQEAAENNGTAHPGGCPHAGSGSGSSPGSASGT